MVFGIVQPTVLLQLQVRSPHNSVTVCTGVAESKVPPQTCADRLQVLDRLLQWLLAAGIIHIVFPLAELSRLLLQC
jgi:hypothetical protein